MATDKNTLKNWFKTGLKPLQAHFWAWLDSYWHKDEKIPMQNIEGIDSALENKAEISSVEAKANADASGLGNENVAKWKEALGVGELPSNIGTVDEGEKVGNTYTKEQVVELLGEKLDAPSGEGSAENFPFVVGVNEENESTKLPAGDLGKNIGNTDLQIPRGTVRTLDITGAKMQFKGLNNKKNDASFGRKIISNEQGELAYSDEADVIINIPDTFKSSASISTTTINVNHIFPTTIPERPSFAEKVQQIMANYLTLDFIPVIPSITTRNNLSLNVNKVENNIFKLEETRELKTGAAIGEVLVEAKIPINFPKNKDFIVKIELNCVPSFASNHINATGVGLARVNSSTIDYGAILLGGHSSAVEIIDSRNRVSAGNVLLIIIKTGAVITTLIYRNSTNIFASQNANEELGDYTVKALLKNDGNTGYLTKLSGQISYKILN